MDGPSFWQTAGSALIGAFVGGLLTLTGVAANGFREQISARRNRMQFLTLEINALARKMVDSADRYVRGGRKPALINIEEFANAANQLSKYATELRWYARNTNLVVCIERVRARISDVGQELGSENFDEAKYKKAKTSFNEAVAKANTEGGRVTRLGLLATRRYLKAAERELIVKSDLHQSGGCAGGRFSWKQMKTELRRGWD